MSVSPTVVHLVGAGPGDPELLTVKAHRLLEAADVILHDVLVGTAIVEELPASATVVDVGKRPGGERTPQSAIHRRMVEEARRGNRVVRLKGGDPCIFGRGGEEAEALATAGVPFEIVPGITSAIGVPEAIGIPLTHREYASSLTVVTGHEDPTKGATALDWPAIAASLRAGGTLVILMGVGRLPDNVAALREHGVPAETPAALIERGTLPDEFAVSGTLETIVEAATETGISPPAVTVVGEVVTIGEAVADAVGAPAGGVISGATATTQALLEEDPPP